VGVKKKKRCGRTAMRMKNEDDEDYDSEDILFVSEDSKSLVMADRYVNSSDFAEIFLDSRVVGN